MVNETLTRSAGIPANASSMSARLSIAMPTRPTSPSARGSSESSPSWVGKSNATLRASCPWLMRYLNLALVSPGVPNPTYCRMVHTPRPIHLGVDAAREGEFAGPPEISRRVEASQVLGSVYRFHRDPRVKHHIPRFSRHGRPRSLSLRDILLLRVSDDRLRRPVEAYRGSRAGGTEWPGPAPRRRGRDRRGGLGTSPPGGLTPAPPRGRRPGGSAALRPARPPPAAGLSVTRAPTATRVGSAVTMGANRRSPATFTTANTRGPVQPAGTPASCTVKAWTVPAAGSSAQSNSSEVHSGQKPRGGQSVRRAAAAARRHEAAGGQVFIEGVELVVLGRLEWQRVDGTDVRHGRSAP